MLPFAVAIFRIAEVGISRNPKSCPRPPFGFWVVISWFLNANPLATGLLARKSSHLSISQKSSTILTSSLLIVHSHLYEWTGPKWPNGSSLKAFRRVLFRICIGLRTSSTVQVTRAFVDCPCKIVHWETWLTKCTTASPWVTDNDLAVNFSKCHKKQD